MSTTGAENGLYGGFIQFRQHIPRDWAPLAGYPDLAYLIRFGFWTIYHADGAAPDRAACAMSNFLAASQVENQRADPSH
jgi:hypothetical protein